MRKQNIGHLDTASIDAALGVIDELTMEIPRIVVDINEKYDKRIKFNLELIADNAVDDYYQDYNPHVYDRLEDLYHTYKVIITDDERKIDLSPSYMHGGHRVSNDYIFYTMFVKGYHGGASVVNKYDGYDYYWRTPVGIYSDWYSTPAPKSKSVYDKIKRETDKYIEEAEAQEQQEIDKKGLEAVKKARRQIKKYLGR